MNCQRCGATLSNEDQFCKGCGSAVVQSSISESTNVSNVQPMYGQPIESPINYGMNNYNKPIKKANNMITIIIGLAILSMVIALGVFVIANKPSEKENVVVSTYKVNFRGFTFSIPDNYEYENKATSLIISDEEGTWNAEFVIVAGSYSNVVKNKNQVKINLETRGYKASDFIEKTIDGKSFLISEISKNGSNATVAYTKANSNYVFGIVAINIDNTIDYDIIKKFVPIINSATYNISTTNMELNTIDPTVITEITE